MGNFSESRALSPEERPLQGVGAIFDADGTLLDSMPIWEDVGARYLAERGKAAEEGLARRLFPLTLEASSVCLKEWYGLAEPASMVKEGLLRIVRDFYHDEVQLKPGARDFLEALARRGVPMVIATSGDRGLLSAAVARLGVGEYFKALLTCSELNTDKRVPRIYQAAARVMGVRAEDAVVFEDALFALKTAHRAGFRTVGVEDPSNVADREKIKALADFYITGFAEMKGCELPL